MEGMKKMVARNEMPADVRVVFESYPESTQNRLLRLRQMICDVAAATDGVGDLEETLKWGQISYLTPVTKSGTTIRIDVPRDDDDQVAMFFNCQTTLAEQFRERYGHLLDIEGNRCLRFNIDDAASIDAAQDCIELALTYHLNKKRNK